MCVNRSKEKNEIIFFHSCVDTHYTFLTQFKQNQIALECSRVYCSRFFFIFFFFFVFKVRFLTNFNKKNNFVFFSHNFSFCVSPFHSNILEANQKRDLDTLHRCSNEKKILSIYIFHLIAVDIKNATNINGILSTAHTWNERFVVVRR